ncbi:hypothetical protein CMT41_12310 [Colwellia sp. MT41]|uniref:hypothetical protein n=1 Tax=Colwellia sp. MT41 TaxID=58049 RepID=UPI000717A952|nr:hypothetical protein [Colwellia sp. MT41]ALO35414.1 hypothetical protein CMT41_12310 [Colwellia sp. MT41]
MSSIKNGYYETCEKLASGISSFTEKVRSFNEEMEVKNIEIEIESAEEFCLGNAMRQPDGNPLKGKEAVLACKLMRKVLLENDQELFNNLKEAGFIHK